MQEQIWIDTTDSGIVSVSGTVNDIAVSFTRVGNALWSTVVEPALDSIYRVVVVAVNQFGVSTSLSMTIDKSKQPQNLKLNWTKDDYYNYYDFNRVEANIAYAKDLLMEIGFTPDISNIKSDWTVDDKPDWSQFNRVEQNLQALVDASIIPASWQLGKTWVLGMKFSWQDALRYEQNLSLMFRLIASLRENVRRSGTFYSGQEMII